MRFAKKLFYLCLILSSLLAMQALGDGYAHNWQTGFQQAASPIMHKFQKFHDLLLYIITSICILVLLLLIYVCVKFRKANNPIPDKFSHNLKLEIIWTIIPVIILIIIAVPSMRILYYVDIVPQEDLTLKVVGHQWYWSYEYNNEKTGDSFSFDSYIVPDEELKPGQLRLLEVDNRVVLPVNKVVKVLITSADVIHSWAIPALGIKMDSIPGRTNETWLKIEKPGVYYGQCSQLCGYGHGFMPIAIEAVEEEEYYKWFEKAKEEFALLPAENNIKLALNLTK